MYITLHVLLTGHLYKTMHGTLTGHHKNWCITLTLTLNVTLSSKQYN